MGKHYWQPSAEVSGAAVPAGLNLCSSHVDKLIPSFLHISFLGELVPLSCGIIDLGFSPCLKVVAEVEGGPFCWTLAVRDPPRDPLMQCGCCGHRALVPLGLGHCQEEDCRGKIVLMMVC